MIASFIPFFLAARIGVNDNAWQHGPEFAFDVHWNITSIPGPDPQHVSISDILDSRLFCRPKGMATLTCRLENGTVNHTEHLLANSTSATVTNPAFKLNIGPVEAFDLNFNERGIENIVVGYKTHTRNINTMRDIVALLSIGANLNGVADGEFETSEISPAGVCNVHFKVQHYPGKVGGGNRPVGHGYELESLPQLNKVPGETILLEKTKNLSNCSYYADYHYGYYGNMRVDARIESRLDSMEQSTLVSDTSFSSMAKRTATFGLEKDKREYVISDTITLALRSIEPAEEEWPPIVDPAETTLVANEVLERVT